MLRSRLVVYRNSEMTTHDVQPKTIEMLKGTLVQLGTVHVLGLWIIISISIVIKLTCTKKSYWQLKKTHDKCVIAYLNKQQQK